MSFGGNAPVILGPGILALIPTFGEDVVAIYDQDALRIDDDGKIFEDVTYIQASIDKHVTTFKHPLENGRSRVDHRIFQPVKIEMRLIIRDQLSLINLIRKTNFTSSIKDIYDQITSFFDAGTLLSIQTKTGTYQNQLIQAMPHEETPKMFDGVVLVLNLEEILLEEENKPTPADAEDSDTTGRGLQNPLGVVKEKAGKLLEEAASIFAG